MSLYKELKETFSLRKKPEGHGLTSERERRLILIGAVAILFIAAISLLLITTAARSYGLESCKSIIFANQRYQCMAILANQTDNYSICSMIPPQSASYQCINTIAKKQANITGCNKI